MGWQPPSADNVDRTPTRSDETAQRVCLKIGSIVMELKKEFVRKKFRYMMLHLKQNSITFQESTQKAKTSFE